LLADGGLRDAVPFRRPGETLGFGQIAEDFEGFNLHNATGIREKGFFVNLMSRRLARIEQPGTRQWTAATCRALWKRAHIRAIQIPARKKWRALPGCT
jgi:hypothetical protein